MSERITRLRIRRGTAAAWTTANPVLLAAELGLETDTRRLKAGDGTAAWASLPYLTSAPIDVRGQVSRQTDFTITSVAAGTYQAIGATGTLDAASGLSLGTTDQMGMRNTSGATVLLRVSARAGVIGGNNHLIGLRLALNGTTIAASDSRVLSTSNTQETAVAADWLVSVPADGEVAMHIANHSDAVAMTLKRATIVASQVQS